jgi:hypothetical protein
VDDDDSSENSIISGDEHDAPLLSQRHVLNQVASAQTPPIPSAVLAADDDDDYDEIPMSSLFLNSFDVDERRIRDLQESQRMDQEYQRVLEHRQAQVDGLFHDLYKSQQTINGRITKINVRLANKLALLHREKDELLGTKALGKEESQDEKPFVFLFPVVKLGLVFGMVLLLSRGEALFPAAMMVWLWWLKESFF